jgi:hypothetical protein
VAAGMSIMNMVLKGMNDLDIYGSKEEKISGIMQNSGITY